MALKVPLTYAGLELSTEEDELDNEFEALDNEDDEEDDDDDDDDDEEEEDEEEDDEEGFLLAVSVGCGVIPG